MSFTPYTPRPGNSGRGASFVFDMNALDSIKKGISKDPSSNDKGSELAVARQFEALFIQQLLKQSRNGGIESGLWNSDQTKMINGMADEQMAMELANGQGMGLSNALVELMNANKPASEPSKVDPVVAAQNTSRLSHLKSTMPGDAAKDTNSPFGEDPIAGLIDMLGLGKVADAVKQVALQIEPVKNASEKVSGFIEKMGNAAVAVSQKSGIPAELILSQAALESGWGKREIMGEDGQTSHNLFGIKATGGWDGKVVHITTTEYVNGTARKMSQPFRAYDSYEDSLQDYAKLISDNPRYSKVLEAPDAKKAALAVQKAGYATDPNYAQKLISIMSYFKPAG